MRRFSPHACSPLLFAISLAACTSSPYPSPTSLKALVLVEASGGGQETEAFVARFLSVLSDSGLGNVIDARLAGGRLDMLRDMAAPEAARFRAAYPGDAYLGLDVPPCGPAGRAAGLKCTAATTLLSREGTEVARFEVSATNSTGYSSDSGTDPETEASRAAAEKAARKLLALLAR